MAKTQGPSHRKPLDQSAIVEAAIALADTEGVNALTMRRLAERLGYKPMALYNHVANKDELLGLMVDSVAGEIDEPSTESPSLVTVRDLAISARAALVNHPWAPAFWQRYLPGPARSRSMENLLRSLANSGLNDELAHNGFHAVTNHVLGYTLQELGMTLGPASASDSTGAVDSVAREYLRTISTGEYPYAVAHVHQHLNGESGSSFELVLDLILDGLARLQEAE